MFVPAAGTLLTDNSMYSSLVMSIVYILSQYERKRILDEVDHLPPSDVNAYMVMKIANDYKARPRRKHRKSHGKISFLNLSKTVAYRWKMLDPFVKKHFEKQGKIEAYLYQQKYNQWLQEQEAKQKQKNSGSCGRKNDEEDKDDETEDDSNEKGGGSGIAGTNDQEENEEPEPVEKPEVQLSIETTSKQNLKTGRVSSTSMTNEDAESILASASSIHRLGGAGPTIMDLEEFPSSTTIKFCPLLAKAKQEGYNLFQDVAGAKANDFF